MSREVIQKINEELNFTGYTQNKVKELSNSISDITSKLQVLSELVETEDLDPEKYKGIVEMNKKNIKDMLSHIYSHLGLSEVEGRFDNVFQKEQ